MFRFTESWVSDSSIETCEWYTEFLNLNLIENFGSVLAGKVYGDVKQFINVE